MTAIDELRANLREWLVQQPGVTDVRDSAGTPDILWAELDGGRVYVAVGPFTGA